MLGVIFLCLLSCVILLVRGRSKRRNVFKLPPSFPGELPIIGHTHVFIANRKDPLTLIKRISKYTIDCGGLIYGRILRDIYFVITDPEDALTVANSCLQKHFFYDFGKNWLGQGLVTGSGDIYNRHRKLLNPKHSSPSVHNFLNIFNDQARKLRDELNSFCGGKPFDPSIIIKNLILETSCLSGQYRYSPSLYTGITIICFGQTKLREMLSSFLSLPNKINDVSLLGLVVIFLCSYNFFYFWLRDMESFIPFNSLTKFYDFVVTTFGFIIKERNLMELYMNGIEEMMELIMQRVMSVSLYNNFLYQILGYQKKENRVVTNISNITNKIIYETKAAMKISKKSSDLKNSQDTSHKFLVNYLLELDDLLTTKEIREELDTNVAASFDTVVNSLITIILLLGTYPEVQDRMYEESIQVLGADRDVTKHDLQYLVYTKAVIKESLRVMPVVLSIARYVDKDVKLKKYTIPANSHCFILPYGINRNPAWGPDVDQFKPERWLDSTSLPSSINFAGFSLGKRSCIGVTYAITLLTVILAHLVRQNKWTADITKVKMEFFVILKAVSGHEISIERRKASV